MRISPRALFYGFLLYLVLEVWTTFLSILEVVNENLFLAIQGLAPWVMLGSTLAFALLAIVIPWDEALENWP